MKPKIIQRESILLVGMSFYGDPFSNKEPWSEDNEIGRVWQRFTKFHRENPDRIRHEITPFVGYEVCIANEETNQFGHFEVFVGVEVTEIEEVPPTLSMKMLPPSTYAVFTIQGKMIASDWYYDLAQAWLPEAGLKQIGDFNFQVYDQRFKGMDRLEESAIDVYIPIEAAS